jgi:hypothetical protein
MVANYSEFCGALLDAGFSLAGGGDGGVFGLLEYGWEDQPPDSPVRWHTGDPDTDPWEWRIRVLDERDDISYAKVFFRKGGYITRAWCPYFLAARRGGRLFREAYADGLYSQAAKRIFETLLERGGLPVHDLKSLAGFGREDKALFDKALTDLQMGLYVTLCGRAQKRDKTGMEYGWASTMLCTTEAFWGGDVFEKAAKLSAEDAADAIAAQVYKLNPGAEEKKVKKFIWGR